MNFLQLFRRNSDVTRRVRTARRPLVENLEGRQLQSGIVGQHIGMSVPMIQGNHIGVAVAAVAPRQGAHIDGIQGQHIGMASAAIQGNHIGSAVASVAPRQGAHIDGIVGRHIG